MIDFEDHGLPENMDPVLESAWSANAAYDRVVEAQQNLARLRAVANLGFRGTTVKPSSYKDARDRIQTARAEFAAQKEETAAALQQAFDPSGTGINLSVLPRPNLVTRGDLKRFAASNKREPTRASLLFNILFSNCVEVQEVGDLTEYRPLVPKLPGIIGVRQRGGDWSDDDAQGLDVFTLYSCILEWVEDTSKIQGVGQRRVDFLVRYLAWALPDFAPPRTSLSQAE